MMNMTFSNPARFASDSLAIEPDVFEYRVVLPVGQVLLPQVDAVKTDSLQTVEVLPMTQAADGTFITTVITTAADEETQLEYLVIFEFGRSNNADLKMIYIDGEELEGFHVDSLTYHVEFPAGSTTLAAKYNSFGICLKFCLKR